MKYIIKAPEKAGIEPAYLSGLDTLGYTVRGRYWASFCSKDAPNIFETDDAKIAVGLAIIIGGTVEIAHKEITHEHK